MADDADPLLSAAQSSGWSMPGTTPSSSPATDPLLAAAQAAGWKGEQTDEPSAGGAFVRGIERGAIPATAGYGGFAAGSRLGAAAGEMLGPVGGVVGGIGGGLLGAFGTSYLAGKAQESLLPESWAKTLGQTPEAQAADVKAHPYWTMAGEILPNLGLLRPGFGGAELPDDASRIAKILHSPAGSRVAGATVMGTQEAAQEKVRGEPIDWGKVSLAAGVGGLSNTETPVARGISGVAERVTAPLTGRVTAPSSGKTPDQHEVPDVEAAPENAPENGSVIGLRYGDKEPERIVVQHYIDKGRAAQIMHEDGSTELVPTATLLKGMTAPPTVTDQPITHPRRIEGELVAEDDLEKAYGDFVDENLNRNRTTATPPAVASDNLPGLNTRALDLANQHERRALYLISVGRPDEARTEMSAAQRWREQFGASQETPYFSPEELAAGREQRATETGPEIMGQRPGTRSNAPEAFTPEEIDRARQMRARPPTGPTTIMGQEVPGRSDAGETLTPEELERARQARSRRGPEGVPITEEDIRNAPPPNVPNILGAEAPGRSNEPESFTREELQAARAQLAAEREARAKRTAPAQSTFGQDLAAEMAGSTRTSAPPVVSAPPAPEPRSATSVPATTPESSPEYSPEYAAADADHRAAFAAYDQARKDYRAQRIGDDQFLAARRTYEDATADWEVAHAQEAARVEREAAQPASTPEETSATPDLFAASPEIAHNSVRGAIENAYIPTTGAALPTEFAIVDARDLVTSNHDDLSPNPEYPQALQPRNRERAETEAQIASILNGGREGQFRPELLGENPDAANGSPIIGPEGYVESGNARSMAIRRAYERGLPQAEQYREYLRAQGYPIDGVENPVLVRINRAGMEMPQREQLARDLNAPPQASMSATDQAMADARQIPTDILRSYRGGDVFTDQNRAFTRSILSAIARPTDLPGLTDPDGNLSRAGRQRVQNALLAKAYGDSGLVGTLTEDADNSIKSIGSALTDAAPHWGQMRDAVARGDVPAKYDLTGPLLEATRLINHAREEGRNVVEYMRQKGLFGEGISPETESVLSWMLGGPEFTIRYGRAKIADALIEYANDIQRNPEIGGLGARERGTPEEEARRAGEIARGSSGELFSPTMDQPERTAGVRAGTREVGTEAQGPEAGTPGAESPRGGEGLGEDLDQVPLTDDELRAAGMQTPYRSVYDQFLSYLGPEETWPRAYDEEAWSNTARDWLRDRNHETGNEHVAVYDPIHGTITHAGTNAATGYVSIPDGFGEGDAAEVHHNHPDGTSLSGPDLSALALPGIDRIVAHGDGDVFSARLSDVANEWIRTAGRSIQDSMADLKKLWLKAYDIIEPRIEMQKRTGHLNGADDLALKVDLVNRALDAAGAIEYLGTRPLGPLSDQVLRSMVRNAGEAVTATARNFGLKLRQGKDIEDVLDQSTNAVPHETAIRGLPRADETSAAGRPGSEVVNPVRRAGAEEEARVGETRLEQNSAGQGPELDPERRRFVPEGTDYIDQVGEEIAAQTGGEAPGTYARRAMLPPAEAQTQNGRRFNLINRDFTNPMSLARTDWRSAQKWNAEQAMADDASRLRRSYRDLLPTFLTATPDEVSDVMKVREWRRLKGDPSPTDGRDTVIMNDGSVPAQLTGRNERVYLDNPRLIKIDSELTQAFQKSWTDLIGATAKKFGWQGVPTSEAISQAADAAVSGRDRRSLTRIGALITAMEGQQRAGYTPFMRFGNYFFAVKPKPATEAARQAGYEGEGFPPVANFQLADSHTPWEEARGGSYQEGSTPPTMQAKLDELRQQFPADQYEIEHGYLFAKENQLRDLNISAIEKMMVLVGNDVRNELRQQAKTSSDPAMAKKTNDQINDLYGRIQDGILDQTYKEMKAGFKRQASNTPGWDPDLARSSAVYLNHISHHVSGLVHQENIDRIDDTLIARHPDPQVRDYWDKWNQRNDTPRTALDNGLQVARRAAFNYALGANVATTAKILTHGPLLGVPTLSTGLGAAGRPMAAGSYIKAMTQAMTGLRADTINGLHLDWRQIKGLTADERNMLENLDQVGTLHAQGADELSAIRDSGERAFEPQVKFNRRVQNIWASNVVAADQMTRAGMALAAYRLASDPKYLARIAKTWRNDQVFQGMYQNGKLSPTDIARFMVDRTAGVYGDQNRMPFLRNRWGAAVGQFHNYEINYLSTFNQLLRNMGPEGKVSAALMLGGLFSLGGIMAFPFVQDVGGAAKAAYNGLTKAFPTIGADMEDAAKALGMEKLGGEIPLHGFSRAAFGIDLGQGIGFGDMISRQTESGLNFLGPAASILLGSGYRAMERATNGQVPAAWASELLPTAVKHAVQAYLVYPEQGVTAAASGKRVMTPQEITPTMQAQTALGFEPADVARAYESENRAYQAGEQKRAGTSAFENRVGTLLTRALELDKTDPASAALLRKQVEDETQTAIRRGILTGDQAHEIHTGILHRLQGAENPEQRRLREVPKSMRPDFLQQEQGARP